MQRFSPMRRRTTHPRRGSSGTSHSVTLAGFAHTCRHLGLALWLHLLRVQARRRTRVLARRSCSVTRPSYSLERRSWSRYIPFSSRDWRIASGHSCYQRHCDTSCAFNLWTLCRFLKSVIQYLARKASEGSSVRLRLVHLSYRSRYCNAWSIFSCCHSGRSYAY